MNKKIKKGISWQAMGCEGVILNPFSELLIGLTENGWSVWQSIADAIYMGSENEEEQKFLSYLETMGFFEECEDKKEIQEPEKFVKWTECYKPLAFTRSCGLHPAEGGPCLGYPHG